MGGVEEELVRPEPATAGGANQVGTRRDALLRVLVARARRTGQN